MNLIRFESFETEDIKSYRLKKEEAGASKKEKKKPDEKKKDEANVKKKDEANMKKKNVAKAQKKMKDVGKLNQNLAIIFSVFSEMRKHILYCNHQKSQSLRIKHG